jgi:hypothetical protein
MKHMYCKTTGLPDPHMSKQGLAWTDRLLKADAKNTSSNTAKKKKEASDATVMF